MKKTTLIAIWILMGASNLFAQKTIENVEIRDLNGKAVMSSEVHESGRPMLLVFWATWCSHTKDGLTSINDDYFTDWQDEFDLQVVAVSVDDARNIHKVRPFVNGKGWEFDIYTDANADFKRAMNVNNAPFFMIVNSNGEVVWQHNTFVPGDEDIIYQELLKLKS
ncbi:MAG: TlpA disulfide reductase family protein [Flavobacteriales bacterium]